MVVLFAPSIASRLLPQIAARIPDASVNTFLSSIVVAFTSYILVRYVVNYIYFWRNRELFEKFIEEINNK